MFTCIKRSHLTAAVSVVALLLGLNAITIHGMDTVEFAESADVIVAVEMDAPADDAFLTVFEEREVRHISEFGAHSITEAGYEDFDSSQAIQDALDFGGVIDFGDGQYKVYKQVHIYSDTMLIGDGAVVNKCFNVNWNQYLMVCYDEQPENIVIQGLTFDLQYNGLIADENAAFMSIRRASKNILFDQVTFDNAGAWCIALTQASDQPVNNSENILIRNCTVNAIDNPTKSAFVLMNVEGFLIENNKISRGKAAIFLSHVRNGYVGSNTIEAVDNYWGYDNQNGGIDLYNACYEVVVDGNVIASARQLYDPLIVAIRSKNNAHVTISNNRLDWDNTQGSAIDVRKDATIDLDTSWHTISGNEIVGTTDVGIKLVSIVEGREINDVDIENNTLRDASIILHGTDALEHISYNRINIVGNECRQISSWKFPNTECLISDNQVYSKGRVGIFARDMVESQVTNNLIYGSNVTELGIDLSFSVATKAHNNSFYNVKKTYKDYCATLALIEVW